MNVLVVTPPAPLVTLDEAREHLRVTTFNEDSLIEGYLRAASAHIDGPFGILKRAVGLQTLEVRSHVFSAIDRLPSGPVVSIDHVKYVDTTGAEQTFGDTYYSLDDDRLVLAHGYRWPALRGDPGGVRIQYQAGFEEVPHPIKQAALLLIGQWFRNRMAVNVGNIVNELPNGVKALLAPYKVWKF